MWGNDPLLAENFQGRAESPVGIPDQILPLDNVT